MSRTTRTRRRTGEKIRDGQWQYAAASCGHHGGCKWCEGNRLHRHARAALMRSDELHDLDGERANAADDAFEWWEQEQNDALYAAFGDEYEYHQDLILPRREPPLYAHNLRKRWPDHEKKAAYFRLMAKIERLMARGELPVSANKTRGGNV